MPTVKLSGGKVLLKGGKVSCSCCGSECCLYPWTNPDDPTYSADLLPDTITYTELGVDYPLDPDGAFRYKGLGPAGITIVVTANGDAESGLAPLNSWQFYGYHTADFAFYYYQVGPCLINEGYLVHDEFEDSYTTGGTIFYGEEGAFAIIENATVARVSLCEWVGTYTDDIGTFIVRLRYVFVPGGEGDESWELTAGGSGTGGYATNGAPSGTLAEGPVGLYTMGWVVA